MGFTIRKASESDVGVIADLSDAPNRTQGMGEWTRPDEKTIAEHLAEVDVWLAEAEGKAVGFVAGFRHFNVHSGYLRYVISSLYVCGEYRRRGIAMGLLEAVIADRQGEEIRQFAVDVLPQSEAACALYEKFGFEFWPGSFKRYRLGFERLEAYFLTIGT